MMAQLEPGGTHKVMGIEQVGVKKTLGIDASNTEMLRRELSGSTAAVLVTPLDHARGFALDADLSMNMVRAAVDVGVKRIVHIGSWTTREPARLPGLSQRFLPTEELLRSLPDSVEWTVLRGGYFNNNLAAMFGQSVADGAETLKFPSVAMPSVDTRDIGEAAAALCLLPEGEAAKEHDAGGRSIMMPATGFAAFKSRFVECSGPQILKFGWVADKIAEGIGKPLRHEPMDVEQWCEGKPPPMQVRRRSPRSFACR